VDAALRAGLVRLRPVIMTALAMIIGMIPMALGIGEGAEQNAPLGRAFIGGFVIATMATLFFSPGGFQLSPSQGISAACYPRRCLRVVKLGSPRQMAMISTEEKEQIEKRIERRAEVLASRSKARSGWQEIRRTGCSHRRRHRSRYPDFAY
jgi:AcrB/AcrD/AcrF family